MSQVISEAALTEILHTLGSNYALLSLTKPTQGIVNQVLFLKTNHGDFVLRVFDDRNGQWKPKKETLIYKKMLELGIPAPEMIQVDMSKKTVPFIYSLAKTIAGDSYSDVYNKLAKEENIKLYIQLGHYLGLMHTVTFDRFGDVYENQGSIMVGKAEELRRDNANNNVGPFATWLAMHQEILEARFQVMKGTTFESLITPSKDYFQQNNHLIDYPVTPRLLHMDFHRGNILIHEGKVVGILDVEESIVGHNEYDLMRTELANFRNDDPDLQNAFFAAYTQHITIDEGYTTRKNFYELSRALVWIKSLILYGDAYSRGSSEQDMQAAKNRVYELLKS